MCSEVSVNSPVAVVNKLLSLVLKVSSCAANTPIVFRAQARELLFGSVHVL